MLFKTFSLAFSVRNIVKSSGQRYLKARTMATLQEIVTQLREFAPENLAEKWDNVGLLVEPRDNTSPITNILLTNDLTEAVVLEAREKNAQMIISYHPPIFAPLKRLTQASWKERIIIDCIRHDIAIYSPHTSWDNVNNGVNDWLAASLPHEPYLCRPILENPLNMAYGSGRVCKVSGGPISEADAVQLITKHTQMNCAMVGGARANENRMIRTYAVCAGSGASVLKGVVADMYITGEMSHHEILEATSNGTCVVLLGHSNSERGFLTVFKGILNDRLNNRVAIHVSESDRDPLQLVLRENAD
ncbi:NIF3-like protein 1 [Anopheles marshallii]|uniref:NIF3-like protein 1 n=1 Tax=Anopheles marshallii TaxID=1521116 RepID=UPI00237A73E5|nr:NIF3-like protein 1 [Anopheles marshallii]